MVTERNETVKRNSDFKMMVKTAENDVKLINRREKILIDAETNFKTGGSLLMTQLLKRSATMLDATKAA